MQISKARQACKVPDKKVIKIKISGRLQNSLYKPKFLSDHPDKDTAQYIQSKRKASFTIKLL